jgi:hypothetical protein
MYIFLCSLQNPLMLYGGRGGGGIVQELYKMAAQLDLSKAQLTELKVHVVLHVLQRHRSQNHSGRHKSCKKKGR